MNENQRLAASIKVGISNYVASAALAVLAGALALFTYISQNFTLPATFYVFMCLAGLALVASIYLGGHGADLTVAKIASGSWSNQPTWQFNWQAILTLLALVFVIVATAIGATSPRTEDGSQATLDRIARELHSIRISIPPAQQDRARIAALERQVRRLERRMSHP